MFSNMQTTEYMVENLAQECSPVSYIVIEGAASESQGCQMKVTGDCRFESVDYCHDGTDFYCPLGMATDASDRLSGNVCQNC